MPATSKLRTAFKRHVIWIVMAALAVALSVMLAVQYRSLAGLRSSLPAAEKALMRNFLLSVTSRVEKFYRESAADFLAVPTAQFDEEMRGINDMNVMSHFERNAANSQIVSYFESHRAKGAKSRFIILAGDSKTTWMYYVLFFYDETAPARFVRRPNTEEWRAAHAGAGYWLYQTNVRKILEPPVPVVNEPLPGNRIITMPVLNKDSMVVAVVGMIVDESYFINEVLPRAIEESLPEFYPNNRSDVIVGLTDANGDMLYSTGPLEKRSYEASEPLGFIFKDQQVGILKRSITVEEAASRVFAINLALSILMTLIVVAGVLLALRTASRQIKLSRMKSDFVSNVSHELRTPLASIRVFGEFFRLGWVREPEKMREYGEYIENESRRLTQLINNILDFSKIESGSKTYELKPADVREVIEETLKAFEVRLAQSGFVVIFEAPDRALPQALINRDAITQSLMNLLDNAVKYSGESKKLLVRLAGEDGYIAISITDYGIGIPREEQDRVFDKFYRVSTGLVHDVKGSGLGLSIVRHIIEAHKGRVSVESQPGRGSTFTILLPAAQRPSGDNKNGERFALNDADVPVGSGARG